MTPAPDAPVVQVVKFRANDRCLADPSLFQVVRDTAQGWQEKGLKAQYWGTSMNCLEEFYWLLFWQSYALATASKADPSYLTFVRDRDALATIVYEIHAPVCGNLQRALESPLVEIGYYLANPDARPEAETHKMITRTQVHFEQVEGFVAAGAGVSIENGLRGVYVNGWRSLEEHYRLGMIDEHKELVDLMEDTMKGLTHLFTEHVIIYIP